MKKNSYLIIYDITSPKHRRELVKILDSYGYRVQYSAYIFHLSNKNFFDLKNKVLLFTQTSHIDFSYSP